MQGSKVKKTSRPARGSSGIGYDEAKRPAPPPKAPKVPLAQRQKEAVEKDPRLKFLDAAKRGDLEMLQTLVAEKSVEGGVDVVVTGDCLRRDLVMIRDCCCTAFSFAGAACAAFSSVDAV